MNNSGYSETSGRRATNNKRNLKQHPRKEANKIGMKPNKCTRAKFECEYIVDERKNSLQHYVIKVINRWKYTRLSI